AASLIHAREVAGFIIEGMPAMTRGMMGNGIMSPGMTGWLHSEMLKTRVAHGYCARHPAAGACPYANICETCDNYVTAPEFRNAITNQLADIQALKADARTAVGPTKVPATTVSGTPSPTTFTASTADVSSATD